MTLFPPFARTEFASDWDECLHWLELASYWHWYREDDERAAPYATKLELVLRRVDPDRATQRGAEGWALVFALRGEWPACLRAKETEISVMRLLLDQNVASDVVDADDLDFAVHEYVRFAERAGAYDAAIVMLTMAAGDVRLTSEQRRELADLLAEYEEPA